MKTLFSSLIFFILTLSVVSQNYFSIPSDSTSEWRVLRIDADGFCFHNRDFKYFFGGDTIIDTLVYHKLYQSGYYQEAENGQPVPGCDGYYVFENIYVGGIRNENGKVYFHDFSEHLIYDFTLEVGDSVNTFIAATGTQVLSIDSVLIGDDYRKRFNVYNPLGSSDWIIEGLGHEKGLIEPMFTPLYFDSDLYCYAENSVPIFPAGSTCDLAVKVLENSEIDLAIILSPNPTSKLINISLKAKQEMVITFRIINIAGNLIIERPWNIQSGMNETSVDISSMAPGIYFVVVSNGNNVIHKKVTLTK
jgi:hypothetical protein